MHGREKRDASPFTDTLVPLGGKDSLSLSLSLFFFSHIARLMMSSIYRSLSLIRDRQVARIPGNSQPTVSAYLDS
jgi:hypothetical protein